jgi:hypothetical protein
MVWRILSQRTSNATVPLRLVYMVARPADLAQRGEMVPGHQAAVRQETRKWKKNIHTNILEQKCKVVPSVIFLARRTYFQFSVSCLICTSVTHVHVLF